MADPLRLNGWRRTYVMVRGTVLGVALFAVLLFVGGIVVRVLT